TTDEFGNFAGTVTVPVAIDLLAVTATATDPAGNTSELSGLVFGGFKTVFANVPATQSTNEDTGLAFTTANSLPVSGGSLGAGPAQVTLAVSHGTLLLGSTAGLTFSGAGGNGQATMTFTGTKDDVNAALLTLVYTPAANYAGNDVLTMTVVAPNFVPDSTNLTNRDTKQVLIRVIPKADAPFMQTFPASGNENTAIPLAIGTALADTDGSEVLTIVIGGVP